jgi:hypothetical protein
LQREEKFKSQKQRKQRQQQQQQRAKQTERAKAKGREKPAAIPKKSKTNVPNVHAQASTGRGAATQAQAFYVSAMEELLRAGSMYAHARARPPAKTGGVCFIFIFFIHNMTEYFIN